MNRQRGFSLIEVIAVMGVAAVMLGIAVMLLHMLLRTEGSTRDHVHQSTVLSRLAEEFRRDIHAATGHSDAELPGGRQFQLAPHRTVTYRVEPGRLIRREEVDAALRRQESFVLPPGTTASIQVQADGQPQIARLLITPAAEAARRPGGRTITIDAVLASDHRFSGPRGPGSEDVDE